MGVGVEMGKAEHRDSLQFSDPVGKSADLKMKSDEKWLTSRMFGCINMIEKLARRKFDDTES
jgi:hypothetical protein